MSTCKRLNVPSHLRVELTRHAFTHRYNSAGIWIPQPQENGTPPLHLSSIPMPCSYGNKIETISQTCDVIFLELHPSKCAFVCLVCCAQRFPPRFACISIAIQNLLAIKKLERWDQGVFLASLHFVRADLDH